MKADYDSQEEPDVHGVLTEHPFICPCCWQTITMLIDLSVAEQSYVEDCEVCCRPLLICTRADRGRLTHFDATPE